MAGVIAIIIIIIIYIDLNKKVNRLESLVKKQTLNAGDNKLSVEKNSDFTKSSEFSRTEKKKDEYQSIQQNIQKSLDVENIESQKVGVESLREHEQDFVTRFFTWLAKDWPMKIGAFLVISAIGWFVSYAFRNDWISPEGRVFLGLLFGILLLVVGAFRSFKQRIQGNVLMVIGGISVLVAIISGVVMYDLFPVELVFTVSLLVVAFLSAMAMKQKRLSFGVVTYLLGAIVPVFVLEDIELNTLFIYLFILTSGTLWIVYKTKWRVLTVTSLIMVALYSLFFGVFEGFERNAINLIFAFMFSTVFYFANISALVKKVTFADLFVSVGTGLLFLLWMNLIAPEDLISIFVLVGALAFAIGSFILYSLSSLRHPVTMYSAVSLALLAVATAIELDGYVLTIALTTEFSLAILVWILLSFNNKLPKINSVSILIFSIPVIMSLANIENLFTYIDRYGMTNRVYYNNPVESVGENLFVVFYVCLISFLIGISMLYFSSKKNEVITSDQRLVLRTFLIIGGIYTTVLVWIVSHLIALSFNISTEIAIMISLIIYTLVGIYFYVIGKKHENPALRIVGDVLFVIVITRVFLVEFWEMDIVQRIITLFVVGVLLVSTVFFGYNKDKK